MQVGRAAASGQGEQGRPQRLAALFLVAALACGNVGTGHAVTVPDLYSVTVTPPEDAEDVRREAFRMAFRQLLVRLTGRRTAVSDLGFEPLLEQAERFVQQWGYRSAEEILVAFDGPAVEAELVRLNEPLWGAERPLTMVWIVVDQGRGQRQIIASEQPDTEPDTASEVEAEQAPEPVLVQEIRETVAATATERGLPLVFPLLDAEDLALVSVADIWGGFNDRIEAASRRYDADAVLIGRIRISQGVRAARWTLLTGGDLRERRGSVRDGVDWLADTYAGQFAVAGGPTRRRVTVTELETLEDYGRVMSFLENLSLVESVSIEQLDGNRLILMVDVRGEQRVLERAMSLGDVLRPIPPPALGELGGDLYFQVAPR